MKRIYILAGITFIVTLLSGILLENLLPDISIYVLIIAMAIVSVLTILLVSIKLKLKTLKHQNSFLVFYMLLCKRNNKSEHIIKIYKGTLIKLFYLTEKS